MLEFKGGYAERGGGVVRTCSRSAARSRSRMTASTVMVTVEVSWC